ncbi:MAG: hypothetical protein R3B72_44185 [Polyangiaceae bacterium]
MARERREPYGTTARARTSCPKRPEQTPESTPELVSCWTDAHRELVGLGRRRTALERSLCLCRWLVAASRLDVATHCGFASLGEYAERHLDMTPRQTEERLRVGRALGVLPALDAAFASGTLVWSKLRELSRIATADTEDAWLTFASEHTAREVERAVASRKVGDRPTDPGEVRRHRLAFEVSAETYALFRDLQTRVARDLGGSTIDDDTLLFEVARRALAGPHLGVDASNLGNLESDDTQPTTSDHLSGRAPYQVAITRCDTCRRHRRRRRRHPRGRRRLRRHDHLRRPAPPLRSPRHSHEP